MVRRRPRGECLRSRNGRRSRNGFRGNESPCVRARHSSVTRCATRPSAGWRDEAVTRLFTGHREVSLVHARLRRDGGAHTRGGRPGGSTVPGMGRGPRNFQESDRDTGVGRRDLPRPPLRPVHPADARRADQSSIEAIRPNHGTGTSTQGLGLASFRSRELGSPAPAWPECGSRSASDLERPDIQLQNWLVLPTVRHRVEQPRDRRSATAGGGVAAAGRRRQAGSIPRSGEGQGGA